MKAILAACLAAGLVAAPARAASLSDIYSSLFVFGDSLSDAGNRGDVLPAPYYNNPATGGDEFSDGPVFADILDNDFNDGLPDGSGTVNARNYAYGGAQALGGDQPDFITQLGYFVEDVTGGSDPFPGTPILGDRPLVTVWFGANDLFGAFETLLTDVLAVLEAPILLQPALFVAAVEKSAQTARNAAAATTQLVGAAASLPQLNDFLVFNLPDIGKTPAFNGTPIVSELASLLSAEFNFALAQGLSALPDAAEIMQVDVFSIFDELLGDPAQLGLTNVTDACFTETVCTDPSAYLFWDLVHPTGVVHAELAARLRGMLVPPTTGGVVTLASSSVAAVPVPAAFPLLLLALGTLGLVSWRTRTMHA